MQHYIDFPNLGIHLELNPQLFTIGPITVHWYGIITAVAFLVIIIGVLRKSERFGLKQDDLIDMMLITTPVGIIGARVLYVLVNWNYYSMNPSKIYRIWEGGLAIYGGIIFGIITIYLFCRRRKISTLQLLDHIVVYLSLGQVVGRWGNFVNQELFGPNTNLPWGMTGDIIAERIRDGEFPGVIPDLPVHPLFLYESLWNLATFFILLWFRKRKKSQGEVFCLYMISYGMARFTIDSLRFDLQVGGMNINRIIGLLFAVLFAAIFVIRRLRRKNTEDQDGQYEPSRYREIIEKIEKDSGADENPEAPNEETDKEAVSESAEEAVGEPSDESAEEAGREPSSGIAEEAGGEASDESAKEAVEKAPDESAKEEADEQTTGE